ncbi:probable leucine-rich repeat receptor-like protein kinase At5g63930 isoform X2 [Gossypium raimondii]|uniref:Protein kinase domain-containing protein n=1 Tax=Gossypium raimondii TaxID=29730 RepID=A0A0D2QYQ6_GOSRA|nr:probable leucine-rich repeat receptor-like protein kinase At5g63930 isoform X2 [Gossypium raimondii]KJB24814.1 hypothetical protein B456_004G162200 [Gossypium raimondii]
MSLFLLFLLSLLSLSLSSPTERDLLLQIKASLDPDNRFLSSWTPYSDPCSTGSFDGVACNGQGRVVNISLQGKGLSGQIPPALGGLKSLTGLYLHFNALSGEIPKEIVSLSQLTDLYLNVNNLSGKIPLHIGNLNNLQVLQLCYNRLTGGLPTQLGSLHKLSVLALQDNRLTGAIPASLGDLGMLTRLDLSFNKLFGSVPVKLANAPMLKVLDIRNNTLSGNVPPVLKRLHAGFQYENNLGLCGVGFPNLKDCADSSKIYRSRPEPFKPNGLNQKNIPESADLPTECSKANCSSPSGRAKMGVVSGIVGVALVLTVAALFTFAWYRRRKQKIGSAFDSSDSRLSTDQVKEVNRRSASPLISLEYSNGWDPLDKGRSGNGFSQEVFESFMFNLEEVERATQCFSETNLLGKSNFSTIYKGSLRDSSAVVVKCIAKTSCKSDESEFLQGLKILTSLKHENLVRLRGFCCSKGRGIRYLHENRGSKQALVHQNLSAEKVLIDNRSNPLLSDSGLHKLVADDIVFSTLKASAAMGYLAPEYTTTGRFTEKSDVYAFGMIVLQILSGKRKITQQIRHAAETSKVQDLMDMNLEGKYSDSEATRLGRIALLCIHESPYHRPSIDNVIQELSALMSSC